MRIQTRRFATLVILLTSFLLSPVTLVGQVATNDWSRLTSVPAGSKLSVKLKSGTKIDGTFTSVSDTALTLMARSGAKEVPRNDVLSVHTVNGKSAKTATLIGMGLGAGAGAILGAVVDSKNGDSFETLDNVATAVTTVLGAGVGALGGFLVGKSGKKRVLIYEAK